MGNGIEAFPLCWPTGWKRTSYRGSSRFKTGFTKAREFLFAEIWRMGGSKIILSTNLQLRLDGIPYANQPNPQDPGAAVYFTYKGKSMVFAGDLFTKVGDNIYAIGLTIEALRGIERWGASDMMERAFSGFKALPSEIPKRTWREILDVGPRDVLQNPLEWVDAAFRKRIRECHPDTGGTHEMMAELNRARDEAYKELGA